MNEFEYTVTSNKTFPEVVEAVEKKTAEMGFRVLHTRSPGRSRSEVWSNARIPWGYLKTEIKEL